MAVLTLESSCHTLVEVSFLNCGVECIAGFGSNNTYHKKIPPPNK